MAFRYRIVLYHENQRWVQDIVNMLDKPMFHLFPTDSDTILERELDTGEVDIILTAYGTQSFVLEAGHDDALRYKKEAVWEKIIKQKRHCQVILICRSDQVEEASELVQKGKIADYFVITPMVDKTRLLVAILKALQLASFQELVTTKLIHGEKLSRDLFESIERVKELMYLVEEEPEAPPAEETDMTTVSDEIFAQAMPLPEDGLPEEPAQEESALDEDSVFNAFPGSFSSALDEDSVFNAFPGSALEEDSVFNTFPGSASGNEFSSAASVFDSLKEDFFQPPAPTPSEPVQNTVSPLIQSHSYKYIEGTAPILLVESSEENVEEISSILTTRGYRHHIVCSGQEGLFQLTNQTYKLLLLSLELPDINTLEMVHSIRQVGPQNTIPIIITSSNAGKHEVLLCKQAGADHIIVKPFKPESLMAHVKEYLGRVKT